MGRGAISTQISRTSPSAIFLGYVVKFVDLALKLAALAAAGQSPALTFEDVYVPAKALSLSGEDPGSVAVLAWLNR